MLNKIQISFSIKDLENLSKIKAHTIRIWEQRYNLLNPQRSDSNIRSYNIEDLQKLLNVALLIHNGYKISHLAKLNQQQLVSKVKEFISNHEQNHYAIHEFKLSMLSFDLDLFNSTFNKLIIEDSFTNVYIHILLPFLEEVGLLWQSQSITPAHEHFISSLIRQKLFFYIEKVQWTKKEESDKVYVLFLPLNEIHELGLLFIHYQLLLKGYQSIYLGESVPLNTLKDLVHIYKNISFVSYFTIKPQTNEIKEYLKQIEQTLLSDKNELHLFGPQLKLVSDNLFFDSIFKYSSISEFIVKV